MWFSRTKYRHEAFISHAVEDKAAIANELCERLKVKGVKVWYSGDELNGGLLRETIEQALDQSRFGVVIFSKNFFDSTWTTRELNWLQKKEKGGLNVILPVLHQMTVEELGAIDPPMASKFCLDSYRGLDYVTEKIFYHVDEERKNQVRKKHRAIAITSFIAFVVLLLAGIYSHKILTYGPEGDQVESKIKERVSTLNNVIESRYANPLRAAGITIGYQQIDSVWRAYNDFRSYYRNEYEFNNGNSTIRGRKNVEAYIQRDLVALADQRNYGLDSANIYWSGRVMADGFRHAGFSLLNKRPVDFTWHGRSDANTYIVEVNYTNEIRYINVSLTFPPLPTGTKRHEMTLLGFAPSETYYFEEGSDGKWYFTKVE